MSNADNQNMRSIEVENFFHDTGEGRIFCTLVGTPDPSKECVVYFSPLFEERMWSHRIAFNFAKELAARENHFVLMFDYYGYGESYGDADDFTLERCKRDVNSSIEFIRSRGIDRFSWWGIRSGCAIAFASLPADLPISSAFLWAPVLDLQEYIYDSLRSTIAAQYMIFGKALVTRDVILEELVELGKCCRDGYELNHIEGYRFGKDFFLESKEVDWGKCISQLHSPSLVLELLKSGAKNGKADAKPTKIGEASLKNPNVSYLQVSDRVFWLIGKDYSQLAESFCRETICWLDEKNP